MRTIAAAFRERATRTPAATALIFGETRITYADLDARAAAVTRRLEASGVGKGRLVAIDMRRSPELVAALLAIDRRRAAYVGIDPAWPRAHALDVLADARPAALVVDAEDSDRSLPFDGPVIAVSPHDRLVDPSAKELEEAGADDLFSISYTSGSTGRPKGVMVSLGSVINKLAWMWRAYPFASGDVAFLHRSCATAALPMDAFGALLQGVPTVISAIQDHRDVKATIDVASNAAVTRCGASVGFWRAVIERAERQPDFWPTLRLARSSGEPLPPDLVVRWRRVFPHARLLNIYGATECSGSTVYDTSSFDAAGASRVPIGTPIPGVDLMVVDDRMRAVPAGDPGELCIGGASLALGYWRDSESTRVRFVHALDERGAAEGFGSRWFRTGDIGCIRPDGQYEILGRRDLQVKVRGYRVEIEEVEAALVGCAAVRAAAVRAEPSEHDARLVAYVVADGAVAAADVRRAVAERVPSYMVPHDVVVIGELPRTSTGKIDRRALADLRVPVIHAPSADARPQTPTEIAVAAIWSHVLGVADIGRDDDFFDLGGHSLSALQIVSRLEEAFAFALPLPALFEHPSVSALAAEIDRLRQSVIAPRGRDRVASRARRGVR